MKRRNFKIICLILAVVMISLATTPVLAVEERIYDPAGALDALMQSEYFVAERPEPIGEIIYDPVGALDRLMQSNNFVAEQPEAVRDNHILSTTSSVSCPTCSSSAIYLGWADPLYTSPSGCAVNWYQIYGCGRGCPHFLVYSYSDYNHNYVSIGGGWILECTRCKDRIYLSP